MSYAHSLATSKLRKKLGASLNESAAAPTSDFAQNQLKKLGWTEGTGLGKNRQGRSTHITVKKREDNVGLGHVAPELSQHGQPQWWADNVANTLAKLSSSSSSSSSKDDKKNKKRKKKNKKDQKKNEQSSSNKKRRLYTDEELFQATGGARFGMRAQRRATGKWARTESSLSEKEELDARSKMEWNGQGTAKMMFSSQNNKTTEDDKEQKDEAVRISSSSSSSSSSSAASVDEVATAVEKDTKEKSSSRKASKKKKKQKSSKSKKDMMKKKKKQEKSAKRK